MVAGSAGPEMVAELQEAAALGSSAAAAAAAAAVAAAAVAAVWQRSDRQSPPGP